MNIIGEKIVHNKLGAGRITGFKDNHIEVTLDSGKIFKMVYPNAFEKFIKFEDTDLQIQVEKTLSDIKQEKNEKQNDLLKNIEKKNIIKNKNTSIKRTAANIAIKCAYCDGGLNDNETGFDGVCSKNVISYNILNAKQTWCTSDGCQCSRYMNGEIEYKDIPFSETDEIEFVCYESEFLKTWRAYAGADTTTGKTRSIKGAKPNGLCVMTTRDPNTDERDRYVFAVFVIGELCEGNSEETGYIGANKLYRIALSKKESSRIKYWNYYSNPNKKDRIVWGSGLFRYITDIQSAQILKDIIEVKKGTSDEGVAINMYRYYCEANGIEDDIPNNSGALTV